MRGELIVGRQRNAEYYREASQRAPAEKSALRYWDRTPYRPNVIFRTLSVEGVRSMVAAGMGITILSDMVYRPWSLEGQRIALQLTGKSHHHEDRQPGAKLRPVQDRPVPLDDARRLQRLDAAKAG